MSRKTEKEAKEKLKKMGLHTDKRGGQFDHPHEWYEGTVKHGPLARLLKLPPKMENK